jgi:hypothetical protein
VSIERFDAARIAAAPWKNGGGLTREIVCRPAGADLTAFDWRVSLAEIAADGAFSVFPGVDRVIILLSGLGVELRSGDGRLRHRVTEPLAPFAFSGDNAIDATLVSGTSSDFNVMTRRGRARADVRVVRASETIGAAEGGVLFAARGKWRARAHSSASDVADANQTLDDNTGVWWCEDALSWTVASADADSALIVVCVRPGR